LHISELYYVVFFDCAYRENIKNTAVIGTGVFCLVLVEASLAGMQLVAAISKIAASCGFLIVAVLSGAMRSTYGKILLSGLAFSFLGDAFLIGESQ
jgi:uncharacterized membrane protein YhhN